MGEPNFNLPPVSPLPKTGDEVSGLRRRMPNIVPPKNGEEMLKRRQEEVRRNALERAAKKIIEDYAMRQQEAYESAQRNVNIVHSFIELGRLDTAAEK